MAKNEYDKLIQETVKRNGIHEIDVLSAKECGCLFCGSVYSARQISDWVKIDDSISAVCPICGSCNLICDNEGIDLHSKDFSAMPKRLRKLEPNIEPETYIHYCTLYQEGLISATKEHDTLYVSYLTYLYNEKEDRHSALYLARYCAEDGKFHKADIDEAILYYLTPSLRADRSALYELGNCYLKRNKTGDKRLAFECFSKSAALGSTKASFSIAYAYLKGDYVRRDEEFGLDCLLRVFADVYPTAVRDSYPLYELGTAALALGHCFEYGIGTDVDNNRAIRYYLISILCAETHADRRPDQPPFSFGDQAAEALNKLCPPTAPEDAPSLMFDSDTFYSSFWDQCDDVSKKEISNIHSENGYLYFDMDCEVPLIITDVGNGKVTFVNHMTWGFDHVEYKKLSDDLRFEDICFSGFDTVEFIRREPNGGETIVLSITFLPVPEVEQ